MSVMVGALDMGDIMYHGNICQGKPQGYGVATGKANTKMEGFRYEGSWNQAFWHGNGVRVMPNGDKYVGAWNFGRMIGEFEIYLVKQNSRRMVHIRANYGHGRMDDDFPQSAILIDGTGRSWKLALDGNSKLREYRVNGKDTTVVNDRWTTLERTFTGNFELTIIDIPSHESKIQGSPSKSGVLPRFFSYPEEDNRRVRIPLLFAALSSPSSPSN
mmetsp:Transcript_67568/g.180582  ORF Transcript_67568/g.180582 Transcript_67568/m.180582 type:complete len:215 (-) Transcript_67568:279-923(-)